MIVYTYAPRSGPYDENVLYNETDTYCDCHYDNLGPCTARFVPVGIVNGRARFAVHSSSSSIEDDMPF